MKKYLPTYGKNVLFLIFFTRKFYQKLRVFHVFIKIYIKKLVFLKLLPIKLFLTIKKITF